ncbi:MAG: hypothetical protein GY771_10405 [bacterium]|nr:hypothetical protein [bacterium]
MKKSHNLRRLLIYAAIGVSLVIVNGACDEEIILSLKAQFFSDFFANLQSKYSSVKIAVAYHESWQNDDNSTSDLRINSSTAALEAYRAGVGASFYLGKESLALPGPGETIQPPDTGCYVGFFPGWGHTEDNVTLDGINNFVSLSGKSVAFIPFSIMFGENSVSGSQMDTIGGYGAVPMVRLMPWGEPYWVDGYQADYDLDKIINGDFDALLTDVADAVIAYDDPVMMTFGVEMNGSWFAWSGCYQGGSGGGPQKYIDAYRHVHDVIENRGANKVTWYFHANAENFPDESWNTISAYYPGDNYVDWVALSVYGAQYDDEPWVTFDEVFASAYNEVTANFSGKPLMIAEWGVMER